MKNYLFRIATTRLICLLALLPVSLADCVAKQADGQAYYQIEAADQVFDWVLDPASGRVFASEAKGDEVIEFSPAMNSEVRRFKVGGSPERILAVGGQLVVLCQKPTAVYLIDLAENRVAASLDINCEYLCNLMSAANDNSSVYVVAALSGRFDDPSILKIDLASRKIAGKYQDADGSREYIVNGAISDSGSTFAFDRRGYISPSGADVARIDRSGKTYRRTQQKRDSFAVMQAGPADRYWTLGPNLVDVESLETIRKYDGHILTVHREIDLAASLDVIKKRIDLWRFSTAKKIKSIDLDELDNQLKPSRRKPTWYYNRDADDPALQFDQNQNHLFCGLRKSAFLIPIKDLVAGLSPLVLIKSPATREFLFGQEVQIPITLTNSKLKQPVEYSLEKGPTGANLEENKIVWTPKINDLGDHQFEVTAKTAGATDRLVWTAKVRSREIDLGLATKGWSVSHSGKYALIWGAKQDPRKRGYPSRSNSSPMDMMVVDLSTSKIVASGQHDKSIVAAAIDDKYFYLITQSSNVLHRFNLDDFAKKKRIFLPGVGQRVFAMPDGTLMAFFYSEGAPGTSLQQSIIDPESLRTKEDDPRTGTASNFLINFNEADEVRDVRHTYDAKSGKIKMITEFSNTGLPVLIENAFRNFRISSSAPAYAKTWGRFIDGSSLRDGKGSQICSMQKPFSISSEFPIGVQIQSQQKSNGRSTTSIGELRYYDLIEGKLLSTQKLFEYAGRGSSYPSYGSSNSEPIQCRGKSCHVLHQGKIFSVPMPDEVLKQAKSPLRILSPSKLQVDLTQPEFVMQLETPDYENVRFKLENEVANVEINEESGQLKIDTAAIWQEKLTKLTSGNAFYRGGSRTNSRMNKMVEESTRRFGIGADQIGFLLPLSIVATAEDGQSDRLTFCLVALGDKKVVDQRNALFAQQQMERQKKLAEERARQRERQQARMEESREAARQRAEQEEAEKNSPSQIEELEKKIRRLEAAIDSLINRIEKLESGKRAGGDKSDR